jgi:hypothetical protein
MIFVRRSSVGLAFGFGSVVNVSDLSAVISSPNRLIEDAELWILQENLQITFGSSCAVTGKPTWATYSSFAAMIGSKIWVTMMRKIRATWRFCAEGQTVIRS